MRFRVIIRHWKAEANIHGENKNHPSSRVTNAGGKRCMTSYGTYPKARDAATKVGAGHC